MRPRLLLCRKSEYSVNSIKKSLTSRFRVDWFVLILFPLKTAFKWGLQKGVKNQGCT